MYWANTYDLLGVELPVLGLLTCCVNQVTAGDSHSIALTQKGKVYGWGAFRNSSGLFGFSPDSKIQKTPLLVVTPSSTQRQIIQIASGADHVLALTRNGVVYSWGCAERGRLGRLPEEVADKASKVMVSAFYDTAYLHPKVSDVN